MEEQSFYMTIPSTVYDAKILDKAKLLYGHISSLSKNEGYCYASNEYLATKIGVTKSTVSEYISQLINLGVLTRVLIYKDNSQEVVQRRLYLSMPIIQIDNTLASKKDNSLGLQKDKGLGLQKDKDNRINYNNNNTISGDEKLLNKIMETYPGNINSKGPLLKAIKSLSKEEKILAVKNIERYKKAANGYYLNLRNYLESKAFSDVELSKKEYSNKLKKSDKSETSHNFSNSDWE